MSDRAKNFLKYSITAMIGAVFASLVIELHAYADAEAWSERFRILSDACTIPGVVILGIGALVMISNEGFFNGISYAVQYAVSMLIPGSNKKYEKYGDYVERKQEKGPIRGIAFLFVVGGVYLALGVLFTVLFYLN